MSKSSAFTYSPNRLVNQIITDCGICIAFDPRSGNTHPPVGSFAGLWDTGASNTVISSNVVKRLGLKPIGKVNVSHANGNSTVNTYLINIHLPNNVGFMAIRVSEGILNGFDVLIGMDIIMQGDFSISNYQGKTMCSFRVPSVEHIDFVQDSQKPAKVIALQHRNSLCNCGSGKKYKRCCGIA
ncbi:SEC-C motif domain protein [Pseudopedobacter saltans DSM 12145]|uniref:SEC-C motif domain protein n=1 Tax=Pseudopedobacter saltans (strain ATCC 51119 / DSM 12145 / JCM 21818 / CCUG 39354 / LMG 10337 / NBRC 100064 / NCIMB 13643) TaxID=762903 RepID=F0SAF1_PSESL|nr:retroviral-like aspartic protease family protein [Pseudopedobacter saltans]ADY51528.1 SEC-C motif domain protein [Pseudopedobacter saltans DSM 12145]